MADEDLVYLLGDHPTTEAQITALVINLSKLVKDFREFKSEVNNGIQKNTDSVDALRLLQKEQNGNVAAIKDRQNGIKSWVDGHTDWHGEEDRKIAARLNIAKGRRDVIVAGWKIVVGFLGSGVVGGVVVKIANYLGVW